MNRKTSTGRTVGGCAGRTWPPLKSLRPERYGMHFEASGPTLRDRATCSCIERWRFALTQTAPQDGPSPLLSKQTRQQQADEPRRRRVHTAYHAGRRSCSPAQDTKRGPQGILHSGGARSKRPRRGMLLRPGALVSVADRCRQKARGLTSI